MENETVRPKAHRVYSVVRSLGIAFWVMIVATIASRAVMPLCFVDALALLAVVTGIVLPCRSDRRFSIWRKIFAAAMSVFVVIEIAIFYFGPEALG